MARKTQDVRPAAIGGLLALVVLVVAAWRAPIPVGVESVAQPIALLAPGSGSPTATAVLVLLALSVLTGCWWHLVALARGGVGLRPLALVAGVWTIPLLAAPPLLSMDAFAYLAQGRMLVRGLDPYADGPVLLGDDPVLGAMDPLWRSSPVPYGPVALLALRAVSLASDGAGTGVLLLRLLALGGVLAAVAAALSLSPGPRRPLVLALTALNPVTVVHLVGGAHVDALLAGGVGLAILAAVRGRYRTAVLLASVAVAVKVVVLPVLLLVAVLAPRRLRQAPALVALAALPFVAATLLLPSPWGFVGALSVPGRVSSWYAPATVAGGLVELGASLLGIPIAPETALLTGRLVVLAVGAVIVAAVLLRAATNAGQAPPVTTVRRAGTVLLVVALSTPAVHAWYLGTALFLLVASGSVVTERAVLVLSSLLALSTTPPLRDVDPLALAAAWTGVVAVAAVCGRGALRRPATSRAREDSPARRRSPMVVAVALAPFAVVGGLAGTATAQAGRPPQAEAVRGTAQVVAARLPRARLVRIVPAGAGTLAVDLVLESTPVCRLVVRPAAGRLLPAGTPAPASPCGQHVLASLVPPFPLDGAQLRSRPGPAP